MNTLDFIDRFEAAMDAYDRLDFAGCPDEHPDKAQALAALDALREEDYDLYVELQHENQIDRLPGGPYGY